MSVPTSLALDLKALHGLETAEGILQRTGQYVMNARMTIGRWGAFKENKRGTAFPLGHTLVENVFCVPLCQNLTIHFTEVQLCAFCKLFAHIVYFIFISDGKIIKNIPHTQAHADELGLIVK
jgi:hypothetical protein